MSGKSKAGKGEKLIMTKIVLLSGSPHLNGSTSMKMLNLLKSRLNSDFSAEVVEAGKSILQNTQQQDYFRMEAADAIVIAFPLYVYCLPGALMEFLVGYSEYLKSIGKPARQKVYAVINCGFPESGINNDAAHVIKRFCEEASASYRFSVMIGGGGVLQPLKMLPSVRKMWKAIGLAFDRMIRDIREGGTEPADLHLDSRLPKKLFFFISETNFAVIARRYGVTKKQLFKKPYLREKTAG
jgi:hypothetical protein